MVTGLWRAQFISSIIMPLIGIINNFGYVLVCIVEVFWSLRAGSYRKFAGFYPYSKQLTHPIVNFAKHSHIIQSTIAAAEALLSFWTKLRDPDSAEALSAFSPRGRQVQ